MNHDTATRITVLKHLTAGRDLDFTATVTHLTRDQVTEIATAHGYPKPDSMKRAIEILEAKAAQDSDLTTKTHTGAASPLRPATTSPSSVTNPLARPVGPPDEIQVLLNTAKAHSAKRIQNAANRVFDDLDRLRALLKADEEKHAERRRAEAEKAAARAEVARLEKQLRDARAKLNPRRPAPTTPTAVDGGPTSAQLRAWAADAGVDCPPRGRVPQTVRDAYTAAHTDTPAAAAS